MASTTTTEKPRSKPDTTKDAIAERVKAQVEEGVAQTQDALEQVASQTADELRKVSDQSSKFVRENPGIAVAGAVGIGVLIGLALRGRG
ncbi:hypothetical protein [Roseovarius sp. 2305UL8-3]|uniref:hypothetical protein n=1 Tax=Roseovarius conchicola TaxID=3121636 RepID=UPI0035289D1D